MLLNLFYFSCLFIFKFILGRGTKAPITKDDLPALELKVKDFQKYLSNIKKLSGQLIVESQQKTGFLGLFFGLESLLGLSKMLLSEVPTSLSPITYLLSYRLSQDHLELFFAIIRSRNENNPNPTCRMFIAAFKGILMQAEIMIDSGNCSILQQNVAKRR